MRKFALTINCAIMNRILLFVSLFIVEFMLTTDISGQTNPSEEDSIQQDYIRRLENIQGDKARMDSLYHWCRLTLNSECELMLLKKLLALAETNNNDKYKLHCLRNIMRCQYNIGYETDTLIASYEKIVNLNLKSKEYRHVLADAKSYLAYQYIYEGNFVNVYDLANEMFRDFASEDHYGLMKANEILAHSYSEIFQDFKALEYAKKAFELSKENENDYSEALYLAMTICHFLNNVGKPEELLTYTNEIGAMVQKEESRKTENELDYYRTMQHAYAIGYYLYEENLDSARIELYKTKEIDAPLDEIDTKLRNMIMARYFVACNRPDTAWICIEGLDTVAPLIYQEEQARVLAAMGRYGEAYEWERYIAHRISWAFDETFSNQIMEMETRYKLFNIQAQKNEILRYALIGGGIAALVIIILVLILYFRQKSDAKKIARANNTQKIFLQNMSHELRTPLNAICGFSQLLTDIDSRALLSDEEIQQYGEIVRGNTDMLSTLVNDILDVSDMESGKYHIFLDHCHPNEICKKAIQTVSYRCPANINLYYTTEVEDDFEIYSDAQRVQQIIINYLTNAMKHTTEGEIHVHCSLKENPDMITFSVTDTGVGVPAEKADLIFERFEKLNIFTQGTGLGLAICRQLATLLQGKVYLDTTYTNGARFVFVHPLKSAEDKGSQKQ